MINKIIASFAITFALSSTALPMAFTPLHRAAASGNIAELQALLAQNPTGVNEKDNNDWTSLHEATCYGQIECIRELLKNNADVNARNFYDDTPLHIAARCGRTDCVRELLKHGAEVSAKENCSRGTPLHLAAYEGHIDCVRELLQHGADFEAKTNDGMKIFLKLKSLMSKNNFPTTF